MASMEYANLIARELASMPPEKQQQVLDFVRFLKLKQNRAEALPAYATAKEIEAFFASFDVDTRDFKFSRDEANTR
jgi:hypothetical protein